MWRQFQALDYKIHLIVAFVLHVLVIEYGKYHDDTYEVPFTDTDYMVFTDAARYVLKGASPYNRSTYRYTPLVAYLLTPNLFINASFGKYLFSIVDIAVAFLIRLITKHSLTEYVQKNTLKLTNFEEKSKRRRKKKLGKTMIDLHADTSMMLWLYNPMTIAIATRGNCDSIAGLLVLGTLYLIQCRKWAFTAGVLHGIAVHFRLYPITYSLALFMHLSKFSLYSQNHRQQDNHKKTKKNKIGTSLIPYKDVKRKTIFKLEYVLYLVPNLEQLKLVTGCLLSLTTLTGLFYFLYGYQFLHEAYLYHLMRRDTRHNFSMYFYLQYLTAAIKSISFWQKILTVLPQIVLILVLSVRFGLNKLTLNFAFLTVTIVMVAYNTVLTSQYFVWILVVLPLCLWQITMSKKTALFLVSIWFIAQAAWLLPAYFLEFQGHNTFMFIWVQSVSFFCANMAILGRVIKNFMSVKFDCKIN
ncbi:hypothetical protein RN001_015331 [Aquatica leii]|uniref:GPI alpha-1,4-mannosyltransferase I, catalytic subunit n=1 Tax=Aquatica leii TaxID=1421715 RepID=A0AAN7SC05_9COLE|nr:hypothetical protein RN001_015331 [Aquatica leii]